MAELKKSSPLNDDWWVRVPPVPPYREDFYKLDKPPAAPAPPKPGPTIKYAAGSAAQTPYDLMDFFGRALRRLKTA